ncbi:MAG: primosomal protein N' [Clostridia bacterium]|nr:primosomal protein N' [Clostridia bacterium]
MTANVAKVCISSAKYEFDRPYDYFIPAGMRESLQPGMRVMVPFGKGNRKVEGMVLSLSAREDITGVKPVFAMLDREPVLDREFIRLALWMRETCFCTAYDAFRAIMPSFLGLTLSCRYTLQNAELCHSEEEIAVRDYLTAHGVSDGAAVLANLSLREGGRVLRAMCESGAILEENNSRRKVGEKLKRIVRIADTDAAEEFLRDTAKSRENQRAVLRLLMQRGPLSSAEISYETGLGDSPVHTLVKKGILLRDAQRIQRIPEILRSVGELQPIPDLSNEQQRVYAGLCSLTETDSAHCALLEGVTGSGKTLIYLHLIAEMLDKGRSCILLVPEISLTPQLIRRIVSHFGHRVAVLHSALSDGERYDQWLAVRDGHADVVIGTRSAVFAPVRDLGLIILDEEQEYSYKSGETPRYHAREVAKWRINASGGLLLLGSATPSVESAYFARSGRYAHFRLEHRFSNVGLPRVTIADKKEDLRNRRNDPVGRLLLERIAAAAGDGKQSILFLNRRGRNKRVFCTECGESISCPKCTVTAAYHSANGRLMCHTCGWSTPMPELCPSCGSRHLESDHAGTQLVEEQLRRDLPELSVLRMDADTTATADGHDELLRRFRDEKIDVLLGTQMVAKGLDFENVTLSAVLDADMGMQSDDFRANERCFSLITQVAGRSGRGNAAGEAVIQTFMPDHPVIRMGAAQDYESFYRTEIEAREALRLPPFYDLAVFQASSERERDALSALQEVRSMLLSQLGGTDAVNVIGPAPAQVSRINNKFRFRLTLRMHADRTIRNQIAAVLCAIRTDRRFDHVIITADMNPYE